MSKEEKGKKKYYLANMDKIQKKLSEIGEGDYWKAKEGKNIIRILPPWSKEGVWYKEAVVHYGVKDAKGKERGYACLKMFDQDCPICDKVAELMKGDAEEKDIADRLRGKIKYYTNILDRRTGKISIWGFSKKTLGILLSYDNDPDYGQSVEGGITNPDEGFDVIVEREGTGRNDTKYQIRCRPKPSAIDIDDWEDKLKNLDEVVEEPDADKLEELVDEMFSDAAPRKKKKHEDDDDDDDDDRPRKKKKDEDEDEDDDEKPRKKKKPSDDDDDDDEEPKKKKKKKSEDDEDDDE